MLYDDNDIFLSSFIAGALYQDKKIECSYFGFIITSFYKINKVNIEEPDCDCDKLSKFVGFHDNFIVLLKDYNDTITIDGKEISVRDYLYKLTTPLVRKYFSIPERSISDTDPSNENNFAKNILNKIRKRTKVNG